MNLEGLTKMARRNAGNETSQMCASQNVPEWRGEMTPHGDAFPNWRVVMVAAAAAAVVENLRVKAGRASALGRYYRSKPDGRRLRAKPSQRVSV
jgi:hypothetical protein